MFEAFLVMCGKQDCVGVTHGDLVDFLEHRIPLSLSEDWDNCGLQLGSRKTPLHGVVCALEPSAAVLAEAEKRKINFIFTHHPLFFKPLRRVDFDTFPGSLLRSAALSGITVYSAHTNLDKVSGGVSDVLADRLGIADTRPLEPASRRAYKLVTFVPAPDLALLEDAVFAAGAGRLGEGRYRECAFRSTGTGSFFPLAGSHPRLGETGRKNLVDEIRFETVCETAVVDRVLEALRRAHPYEVPAYDLVPLAFEDESQGLGRIGVLERARSLDVFVARVRETLGGQALRLVGDRLPARIRRVALCGGSGFSLYRKAAAAGADIYLTGDLKYHEAREVIDRAGIPVLDAGHFATERPVLERCAAWCREFVDRAGLKLPVVIASGDREPWEICQSGPLASPVFNDQ